MVEFNDLEVDSPEFPAHLLMVLKASVGHQFRFEPLLGTNVVGTIESVTDEGAFLRVRLHPAAKSNNPDGPFISCGSAVSQIEYAAIGELGIDAGVRQFHTNGILGAIYSIISPGDPKWIRF